MLELLSHIGVSVRDAVLYAAGWLKFDFSPGLVTLALLAILIISVFYYLNSMNKKRAALAWMQKLIADTADNTALSVAISQLDNQIQVEAKTATQKRLAAAWREYRETLVAHEEAGRINLRNAVRPSIFFNVEDLQFTAGGWRVAPGLFVSTGLFLTFLGLISALNSMDLRADQVQGSLRELLTIASAKFIMSLTGLFCSIIFTIVLRKLMSMVESDVYQLCATIEKRLTFISLENLAVEQLAATREQREHFRMIGLELVAELGRPLREELPAAISTSISNAMGPLIQQVGQLGTEGVGEMVKGLSSRFSDDVGQALAKASESLIEAGNRISKLSDRMDQSSGKVSNEIDIAVGRLSQSVDELRLAIGDTAKTASGAFTQGTEQLLAVMNQTLEGIRVNTAESAQAISVAAVHMREAAEKFKSEIEKAATISQDVAKEHIESTGEKVSRVINGAGTDILDAFGLAAKRITDQTNEFANKASQDLLSPLEKITGQLDGMVTSLSEGAGQMRRLSDGMREGASATEQAAANFREASKDLVLAVNPIMANNSQILTAVEGLRESVSQASQTVARSSHATAQSASQILQAAQSALDAQSKAINGTMAGLSGLIEQMEGQGSRIDDIDEKLGRAFDEYTKRVSTAVESLFGHVSKMQEELNPALDTLREIVEQAEQFKPESRKSN